MKKINFNVNLLEQMNKLSLAEFIMLKKLNDFTDNVSGNILISLEIPNSSDQIEISSMLLSSLKDKLANIFFEIQTQESIEEFKFLFNYEMLPEMQRNPKSRYIKVIINNDIQTLIDYCLKNILDPSSLLSN